MTSIRAPLIAILLCVLSGQACAQFGGGGTGMRRGGSPGGGARPSESMSEVTRLTANDQIRLQLTDARLALHLTSEQNPSWQAYEDRVLRLLADLSRGADVPSSGSALKQIDARIDIVRNRLTAMEDLSDTARKLYAVLSEEQKAVADRTLPGTVPTLYSGIGAPAPGRNRPTELR